MSRISGNSFRGTAHLAAFRQRNGLRIVACFLLLVCMLLNASCGFLSQSAGEGNNQQTLKISGTFPEGFTQQAYNTVLAVSGGSAPYQFVIKSGSLPPGMVLNPSTGSVSGTPTATGTFMFQVSASDAPLSHHGSQNFQIIIAKAQGGGIRVTVSPSSVNVTSGATQPFTAAVSGTDNTGGDLVGISRIHHQRRPVHCAIRQFADRSLHHGNEQSRYDEAGLRQCSSSARWRSTARDHHQRLGRRATRKRV